MAVWSRAHSRSKISEVFSGDGGLFVAGRWNYKGRKVVYCSQSIALSTLEWLSHNGLTVSGFTYHKFAITVPDELITTYKMNQLPTGYDLEPATDASRDFSEVNLFKDGGPLAMSIPSVVVPEEKNLIINPLHDAYVSVIAKVNYLGQFTAPLRK